MKNQSAPYFPPAYDKAVAASLQALQLGKASEAQQKRALDWIIQSSGTYDLSYRPESDRDTAFAEGKRFVGLQIVKLLNMDLSTIKEDTMNGRRSR